MPTLKIVSGLYAHSVSPGCHRLVRLVSRPRVFLLGSRQPCRGTSSSATGMSSSSPSDSDVEEAVEGDTVAVGSNPAAVTGETCTRVQHPTSWEDAVDRWAKGQGDALKPCKASQCRGKCCFRSPDVKAPWCYTRAGARCKVVTVDSPPRSSPRGVEDGVESDEAVEDDEDDVTSSEEDVEDEDGYSSSAEDEEDTEDEEAAEDGGWKMEEMGCKICCIEGSWCNEIRQRFAASLGAQRRKIMSEFRKYHRRIPKGGSQGVIIMSSAVRQNFTYPEFYGDSMDSKTAKDALRRLGLLCKSGVSSESVAARRQLHGIMLSVKNVMQFLPKDALTLRDDEAKSFLVVLKNKLTELCAEVAAMSDGNARDKQVAPGTPGENDISESGGGYGDDGGVRSDGSGGRSAGATIRSRSSSPEEGEDGGDSSREQREAAPAATRQAADDPLWSPGIASAFYASNERNPAAEREKAQARTVEQTRVRLEAAKRRAESALESAKTAEQKNHALALLAEANTLLVNVRREAGAEENTAAAAGNTVVAAGDTAPAADNTAAAAGLQSPPPLRRSKRAKRAECLTGKRPRSPCALPSNPPDVGKKRKTDGRGDVDAIGGRRIRGFKQATDEANVAVTSDLVQQREKLAEQGFFLAEFGATEELLTAAKSTERKYAPIFEVYPHRVSTGAPTGDAYPELHCQVKGDAKELWPRQQSVILSRKGKTSNRAAREIVKTLRDAAKQNARLLTEDDEGEYGLREATFIKDQDITRRFLGSLSGYHQQKDFEFPAYVGPSLQTPHRDAGADASRAFSCVVALEENTFLRLWPGTHIAGKKSFRIDEHEDIHIPIGKMLVFDSSLYHAGLGNGNMRLHFQYDDMKSDAQSTHFSNVISRMYWRWVKELSEPQAS